MVPRTVHAKQLNYGKITLDVSSCTHLAAELYLETLFDSSSRLQRHNLVVHVVYPVRTPGRNAPAARRRGQDFPLVIKHL